MDVWFARYTLTPRRRLSAVARDGVREGALLRAGSGFADVHPWPELGDLPLDHQLAMLARGETTSLTAASLRHAAIDGAARERGVSLFDGLTIPLSHWPGADPPSGFDTVKLKDVSRIPDDVRLRIDFNATLDAATFLRVAQTLPRERVDFIEDPCAYDAVVWRRLRSESGLRLALDRPPSPAARERDSARSAQGEGLPYDVIVHKPAIQPFPNVDKEVVVTSYMDHPLGQFFAAYVAATHDVSDRCGLFTHVLYEREPFIEQITADGARLLKPPGTGIGFDDLLARLPWRRLA